MFCCACKALFFHEECEEANMYHFVCVHERCEQVVIMQARFFHEECAGPSFFFSRSVCNNVFVHSSDFAALLSRGVNCARECGCDWC